MKIIKKFVFSALFLLTALAGSAQTQLQNLGWLTLVNNTKISEKWGVALDLQIRSAERWRYIKNLLVRPGVTYYLNASSNLTVGYLFAPTHIKLIGGGESNLLEQRIWEQFVYNHKIKSSFATHRFRLEQRFMETSSVDDVFAQRFRYFFRILRPLQDYKDSFDQGVFVALQDEIFLNIQNKELLNDSLFDQNRFYFAAGYRISKKLDVEAGYLNQYINGAGKNTSNRVVQLAIYTRF